MPCPVMLLLEVITAERVLKLCDFRLKHFVDSLACVDEPCGKDLDMGPEMLQNSQILRVP